MSVTTLASPSSPPVTFLPVQGDLDSADVRVVRFDDECILIPVQNRRRSRVVTKSYSLPLWKRRSDTDSSDGPPSPQTPSTVEDAHVVIKVPLPSFIIRSPRLPSRARSTSPRAPLSSCLVNRSPSTSASPVCQKPDPVLRKPSFPLYHQRKSNSIVTVPLRACCPDCVPITEESMREGEQWKVRFTHGARRRRTASLDSNTPRPSSRDGTGFSDDMASLTRLTITIDEVDRRRRSLDLTEEDLRRHKALPHPSHMADHCPSSSAALSASGYNQDPSTRYLAPMLVPHLPARSSPIQEEDEDQLFPLPASKRTPSCSSSSSLNTDLSPRPSPSHSRSSSVRSTPIPSPNTSTSCLNSTPARLGTSFDDSILGQSIRRKTPRFDEPTIDSESQHLVLNDQTIISRTPSVKPSPPMVPPRSPPSSSSSYSSPSITRRSVSMPTPTHKKSKRTSFSFLKAGAHVLKGASVDVLKGVGLGASIPH